VIGTIRIPEIAPITESQQERDLSRQRGPDADQTRAEPVDGGGAQRLAIQRKAEEQPEPDNEGDRDGIDRNALRGEAQADRG